MLRRLFRTAANQAVEGIEPGGWFVSELRSHLFASRSHLVSGRGFVFVSPAPAVVGCYKPEHHQHDRDRFP
jgi:hypothetical protein